MPRTSDNIDQQRLPAPWYDGEIDDQTALRFKKKLAEEFREQPASLESV